MSSPAPRRFQPPVGPKLKIVLQLVLGLFAVLAVNSVYLSTVTFLGWKTGVSRENQFYLLMVLVHLGLGLLLVLPTIVFLAGHLSATRSRPNVNAKRMGWGMVAASVLVLVTGLLLLRPDVGSAAVEVRDPARRAIVYWLHVAAPLAAAWLFVLHRLAGRRIKWKVGGAWAAVAAVLALAAAGLHGIDFRTDPRLPEDSAAYFEPSLARTASGGFIPAESLMSNEYCLECHADTYESWSHSVHAFSSFNNPMYAFSVQETRRVAHEKDGSVQDARFCAGCHDPVPFFSGAFEDARWDDPTYDVAADPLGAASITCVSCHSIVDVHGTRGNADYTIEESPHYPFAFSESPLLRWASNQLVKAKPGFHKATFLKPFHRTAEFCSTCHKVSLPESVIDYKWVRGQNHYDSFLLSGLSGHGAQAWHYPPKAEGSCNDCHMQPVESDDFGAKRREGVLDGKLAVRSHLFPAANTAIPQLVGLPERDAILAEVERFNQGSMRVDIVAIHAGEDVDDPVVAPLRPEVPALEPGRRYLLDTLVRTLRVGHEFTQGTADSNEPWLEVTVRNGDRIVGKSGGLGPDGEVDPWSKFLNMFMLDRDGERIDRRNVQEIFVPLYNRQVPPGAAELTQYLLAVPPDATGTLTVEVALRYRKFDTTYLQYVYGPERENDLPILTLATDSIEFPIAPAAARTDAPGPAWPKPAEPWQRMYDYGIGLFRTGDMKGRGLLRQAEDAFRIVADGGHAEGFMGLARTYLREGRLDEAAEALRSAAACEPPALPWSLAWFGGLVEKQQGSLDAAIASFRSLVETPWASARERGFDFSRDVRVRNELAETLLERSRLERGETATARRAEFVQAARAELEASLAIDSEQATARYLMAQVFREEGNEEAALAELALHETYKVDDNARDRAVALARQRYPAANAAAEPVVIFDLNRDGAYGLPADGSRRVSSTP
jgi:tetratricopeptide (TPR) repeat protein